MATDQPAPTARDRELADAIAVRFTTGYSLSASDVPVLADDIATALATVRAEERERAAMVCATHAERLKHTSHRDGLGMGWQAGELVCEELASTIRRGDAAEPGAGGKRG